MFAAVKALDVYPKTLDDFKERTSLGASVSVVCCVVIVLLVVSELRAYVAPTTLDQLHVDTTRSARIHINFNLTFPSMPCSGFSLVAMDVAGEQQIDVVSNIVKTRLTLEGKPLGGALDDIKVVEMARGCGECFPHTNDLDEAPGQCCNSCEDVQSLYPAMERRLLKWEDHPLCLHEVRQRVRARSWLVALTESFELVPAMWVAFWCVCMLMVCLHAHWHHTAIGCAH